MKPADNLWQECYRLLKPFRLQVLSSAILGIIGGLSTTALLATINRAMNNSQGSDYNTLLLLFAGLCLTVLLASTLSNLIVNHAGQRMVMAMRQRLARQILLAPIEQLERFRHHRLIPILVQDVNIVSDFTLNIAPLIVAVTISLGCFAYLGYLSWQMLLVTLAIAVIGSAAQWVAYRFGSRYQNEARDGHDDLQRHYQALSNGAKELRIQRQRRHHMFEQNIKGATARICRANIRAATIFISAETFGSTLFFFVIGAALVYQTLWPSIDNTMLGGFVLVMLYMRAPLSQILNILPNISRAQVAFERITELSQQFQSPEPHLLSPDIAKTHNNDPCRNSAHFSQFQTLQLDHLQYRFPVIEGSTPFALGPISLTINASDIVFIVGENGCGKTTLIKLLLGLYTPQQGRILLDGKPVDNASQDDYRQLFTTIFSDYHLFEELIQGHDHLPEQALAYLQRMDIAHKVGIRDGAFTTTDLSTGQRKRLALVNAWLEDRDILVFDEWAADQDPAFRRVFYTEFLPDLKQLGKTIIVISHDDRYFNVADKLVQLAGGKIVENVVAV
ncbi:cyclic peptide export ABC transporter [Oceanobacter antarcticus]|uniref:Cyclic peptide export ABC transporter n=1 Tax=Oceanobacter antarcticus TaxID=3133425 RepID=A0ABW8NPI9_9GAMM